MKKLIIASGNKGKLREMKAILGHLYDEILSMQEAGIDIDVVEDGTTFEENAKKKAMEISLHTDHDVISDDSGLSVFGLGGRPGVYSARYSKTGTDEDNNKKLVDEVKNLPESERGAEYVCVIALASKGEVLYTTEGRCEGEIHLVPMGEGGFGYDPYFYLPDYGMTFAQMDPAIKNGISHRAIAIKKLKQILEETNR